VSGQATTGPLAIEMWDPGSGTWTTLASMAVPRMYHSTAMLMPDGRVLAAGGGHNGGAPNNFSAQVFSPPYLFQGARPSFTNAPDAAAYGAVFTVDSPDAPNIGSVSLIDLASSTHSTDMSQVYAELAFTKSSTQLSITAPQNGDQAPPGYYMLFIVNSTGVPSVAKILLIGSSTVPPPPPPSPNIGITTIGAAQDTGDSNYLNGSLVKTTTGGTIKSMSVYVGNIDSNSNGRQYGFGIYTDNGGRPGTLIAASSAATLVANSWNTIPITASLGSNTSYWLMYNTNGGSTSTNNMYYQVGQGAYSNNPVTFGNWPATFPAATISNGGYSLYATFGP
jgi:hypothetical protein